MEWPNPAQKCLEIPSLLNVGLLFLSVPYEKKKKNFSLIVYDMNSLQDVSMNYQLIILLNSSAWSYKCAVLFNIGKNVYMRSFQVIITLMPASELSCMVLYCTQCCETIVCSVNWVNSAEVVLYSQFCCIDTLHAAIVHA